MNFIFKLALFSFAAVVVVAADKKVVCYYGTWATYRPGLGQFNVDDVNVDLCTHVVYTFVGLIANGTVVSLDPGLDLASGRDNLRRFNDLKQKNPNLKTILAVGGRNDGSANYSIVAASAELRQTFIQSSLDMLLEYGFDGYDIDWEYPNKRDTVNGEADIENFTTLLKEFKEALSKNGLSLSIAATAVESSASTSYNIKNVAENVDYISVMAYDFYGAWDNETGHNAPLHKSDAYPEVARRDFFSVDVVLEYWINSGCPPEKIILGLPLYGRSFNLTDPDNFGVRAKINGVGIAGPYTASAGTLGYNELCAKFINETWDFYRDSAAKAPYAVQGRNWVSYDDPQSLKDKVDYGLKYGIGGAMVWSIETDDFHGNCHGVKFPLLRAINSALGRIEDDKATTTTAAATTTTTTTSTTTVKPTTSTSTAAPTTTTTAPTSTTTEYTTTVTYTTTEASSTPEPNFKCYEEGFFPYPGNCNKFIRCVRVRGDTYRRFVFNCPAKLQWDQKLTTCNYANVVKCV